MSEFQRYAVYFLPADPDLAAFGASWLGWDIATGRDVAQPPVDGVGAATQTPRKYGFHGTLKPPFRLAEGTDLAGLQADMGALANELAPVTLEGLALSKIGSFLALVPKGDAAMLGKLAFDCVKGLDRHRRSASADELARRRASGLSPRQDALLVRWGYPYVADEFRFHLTLTGRLDPAMQDVMISALADHLPPLPRPFVVGEIALVGERADGIFREIQSYTLNG